MTDNQPPQDLTAEQAVLGGMMTNSDAIADVLAVMTVKDFYRPAHQSIADAILTMHWRSEPIDTITVAAELERRGQLSRAGGAPYLHTCLAACVSWLAAGHYAKIVLAKSQQRQLLEHGNRCIQLGRGDIPVEDIAEVIENARQSIDEIARGTNTSVVDDDLGTMMSELLEELSAPAPAAVPTGLYDLDACLNGGLYGGQLIIVAARPATGKSVMGFGFASYTAKQGRGALFASLEMSKNDCMHRLCAAEGCIDLPRLVQHKLNDDDWRRLSMVTDRVSSWPLHIDPRPNQTVTSIRARGRDLSRRPEGLGIIVVDYLQLMTSGKRVESRQQEVSEFSRQLKLLAKELDVPVVAICQLNRGPEQRTDKRPMLSDLRESGSLEQDADVVILLHRDRDPSADQTVIEAIVAKQRQGPTTTVSLRWRGHYSRIDSIAGRHLEAV